MAEYLSEIFYMQINYLKTYEKSKNYTNPRQLAENDQEKMVFHRIPIRNILRANQEVKE